MEWTGSLRRLAEADAVCAKQRAADRGLLSQRRQRAIREPAADLPTPRQVPGTSCQDRKRIVGLLIESVTIIRQDMIALQIRLRGGASALPAPPSGTAKHRTPSNVIAPVDELIGPHTDAETAAVVDGKSVCCGTGLLGIKPGAAASWRRKVVLTGIRVGTGEFLP